MINKKISTLLFGLSVAPFALAGTMGDAGCTSVLCAINNPGGVYAGIAGLYMQPAETGLGLVTDSWLYGGTARSKPFNVNYKWAGNVKLGYDMPSSANNIEANYLFLSNTTHAINDFSDGSTAFGSILFPNVAIPAAFLPGLSSNAYLKYEVNQVDLKVGRKYNDMSGVFHVRGSLGVRYAELKHSLTFAAPGNMISRFSGTGPMFSVDSRYQLSYGLGLVGYFDYAMLAGQSDAHSFVTSSSFVWPKRQRVVNNVTAKVGLDYTYAMSAASVTIEGGYQVNQYFDAFNTIRGLTVVNPGDVQRVTGFETNNFAIQGPYIGLTVHA